MGGLTCAGLLGGSLKPKNCPTRARPFVPKKITIDSDRATVNISRKSDKKSTVKSEAFHGKEKHAFRGGFALGITVKDLKNKRIKS
jgi:hypothetical protein